MEALRATMWIRIMFATFTSPSPLHLQREQIHVPQKNKILHFAEMSCPLKMEFGRESVRMVFQGEVSINHFLRVLLNRT